MNETLDLTTILRDAVLAQASDIFIVGSLPLTYKVNGSIVPRGDRLMPDATEALIRQIYGLTSPLRDISPFLENGDDDFSFSIPGLSRFRVSTYKQRGSLAASLSPTR